MYKSEKSHDTALRIIEILKMLLKEDISKKDIINKLNYNNEILNVYSYEVYLKYFNTFKELGLNIVKINDKYCLKNALFYIELSQDEEEMLNKLFKYIPKLNNKKQEDIIINIFKQLDKYTAVDLKNKVSSNKIKFIEEKNILYTLKQALNNNLIVCITYINNDKQAETLDVEIKKIIEEKDNFFVLCKNANMQRNKRINIEYITEVKLSPKQSTFFENKNTVVFEVYGRLSKSYRLRPWEIVSDFGDDYLRIINTQEDFESFLPRLLKYGENCKILKPKHVVDNFFNMTNNILKNLEEPLCAK